MLLVLHYLPAIVCGIHAVRTGRQQAWLWVLIVGGSIGAAVYFFAVIVPDMMSGRTGRAVGRAAVLAIDPERDYRNALRALDDTPSIANRMKVAQAAGALGRWSDAEAQWALCGGGHWGDDATVLLGHANALLELDRPQDALAKLEHLRKLGGAEATAPLTALAFARASEALGRNAEADEAYHFAADRVPGLEAGGRYVAFMAATGRREDAEIGFAEIERRYSKIAPPLRPYARLWRDMAANALGRT